MHSTDIESAFLLAKRQKKQFVKGSQLFGYTIGMREDPLEGCAEKCLRSRRYGCNGKM